MASKKRPVLTPFNLAFLDIMFCGFGAVLLLVLILNHDTFINRHLLLTELDAEIELLEQTVTDANKHQVALKNNLLHVQQEQHITEGKSQSIIFEQRSKKIQIVKYQQNSQVAKAHVKQLQADLLSQEQKKQQQGLGNEQPAERQQGRQVRAFTGHGDRQYLTGLKMDGKRTLILIDSSASMLDQTLVNIIRLRNMDDQSKRRAQKWQRAIRTCEWLVANLPVNGFYQIFAFNTEARPLLANTATSWLSSTDSVNMDKAIAHLKKIVPQQGTSLAKAFAVAIKLRPRPDNILLITDGLPTQGSSKPSSHTVSAEQRLLHFRNAVEHVLPKFIPVNTLLLPMEGDVYAAAAFWQLAIKSYGSFITPAQDWP